MSITQIVLRTIVTTVDLLLSVAVLRVESNSDTIKKFWVLLVMLNLAGVWI